MTIRHAAFALIVCIATWIRVSSAQSVCTNSTDCFGGTCFTLTGYDNTRECRLCPNGQTGFNCEQPSNIKLSNGCASNCGTGRCLLNSLGVPVCADTDVNMPTTFLSSRKLPNNATYGPYVCGVTAPCSFNKTLAVYTPRGACGTDYTLTMFGTNPYNPSDKKCGEFADVCIKGPFRTDRIFQTQAIATGGTFGTGQQILVQCSKIGTYLQQYPTLVGTHSDLLLSYYAIIASSMPAMCAEIPGKCATGTCVRQTGDFQIVDIGGGVWRTVPSRDICCPLGRVGNNCEIESGCSVSGCIHGGTCLTKDQQGRALAIADTRCFGCQTASNSSVGYQGVRCEVPSAPTFLLQNATTGGSVSRRLLDSGTLTSGAVVVRNQLGYTSPTSGVIYREPSRVCDCGVKWSNQSRPTGTERIMQMGNYPAFPSVSVLLSSVKYDQVASVDVFPYYSQAVNSVEQAKYLCYKAWSCAGIIYNNATSPPTFFAVSRVPPPWTTSLGPVLSGTQSSWYFGVQRIQDTSKCPDATLDPVWYCNTYPLQCQSIRNQGGVGNVIAAQNTPVSLVAWLHFEAFGHVIRNSPNANCVLTTPLAEDQQGCTDMLRAPKAFYALAPGQQLTAEICGNSSRIDPVRVEFGPLFPGVTGTNTTNGPDQVCLCYPPFRAANTTSYQDCSYDLCGIVDGRGKVNATYANLLSHPSHFNHSDPQACVCYSPWGTDPASCGTGSNTCNWCSATRCQNGGTVNPSNFSLPCDCNSIFTGDRCEVSLCNATNSIPFNYTQWVAAGKVAEQIVCNCKPGWTGKFCDKPQCVYGIFDFEREVCKCLPGYTSSENGTDTCDRAICDPTKGSWIPSHTAFHTVTTVTTYIVANSTRYNTTEAWVEFEVEGMCGCQLPWKGPLCEQHYCDDYNVVESLATNFQGVRPYGVPQLTDDNDATWKCACTWPYIPNPYNMGEGRALDCSAHDCNFGLPNSNASNVVTAVDACTCQASATGLLSVPEECTGFSHDDCPNACLRGTCGLSSDDIAQTGYVTIGNTPECCRCSASQGYRISGECQPFCAFYQPCLTTALSGFVANPNYNASLRYDYANPNISRYSTGNDQWVCQCRSDCVDGTDPRTGLPIPNTCNNCTLSAREAGTKPTDIYFGSNPAPPTDNPTGTAFDSSSSKSFFSNTATVIAIFVSVGIVAIAIVAAIAQSTALGASGAAASSTSSMPAKSDTPLSTKGKRSRGYHVLPIFVLCLAQVVLANARYVRNGNPRGFVYPDTAHWDRWYNTSSSQYPRIAVVAALGLHPQPDGGSSNFYCDDEWNPRDFNSAPSGGSVSRNQERRTILTNARFNHLDVYRVETRTYVGSDGSGFGGPPGGVPSVNGEESNSMSSKVQHRYSSVYYIQAGDFGFAPGSYEVSVEMYGPSPYQDGLRQGVAVLHIDTVSNLRSGTCEMLPNGPHTPVVRFADSLDTSLVKQNDNLFKYDSPCGYVKTLKVTRFCVFPSNDDSSCSEDIRVTNTQYGFARSSVVVARGCQCRDGFLGNMCDQLCPDPAAYGATTTSDTTPLCSMRGRCNSDPQNPKTKVESDGVHYCRCAGVCICDVGYGGARCEKALWPATFGELLDDRLRIKNQNYLNNAAECCPSSNPKCSPITSYRNNLEVYPSRICPNGNCFPGDGSIDQTPLTDLQKVFMSDSRHLNRSEGDVFPFQCGEGLNENTVDWIPTRNYNAGHGRCELGTIAFTYYRTNGFIASNGLVDEQQIPYGTAFCWCNNPGGDSVVPENPNKQHGWWGTPANGVEGCTKRTCTSIWANVRTIGSDGKIFVDTSQRTSVVPGVAGQMQCSNRSAVTSSSASDNYAQAENGACADTTLLAGTSYRRINTPGLCKQCLDGWGYHTGFNKSVTVISNLYADFTYNGLCDVRTMHSRSGSPCGGYGIPSTTQVTFANGKSAPYVTGCTCPASWGLTTSEFNGGLCLRSCAGDASVLPTTVSFTGDSVASFDADGNFIGPADATIIYNTSVVRCGGYRRGLCRPIVDNALGGGFNSACMCNPGFNGPQCTNQTELWYKGTLCGPDGEAVLQAPPVGATILGDTKTSDEDWFLRYIVPMNTEASLNSKQYSAYKCQCKAPAEARGWVPNSSGICRPGCGAVELRGTNNLTCSGNGRCIDDPTPFASNGAGKVCQCNLGFDGTNCARPNLRTPNFLPSEGIGRQCGGVMDAIGEDQKTPRGKIVYADAYNMTQRCQCTYPYTNNQLSGAASGLCWRNCSNGCTSPLNGACGVNATFANDQDCVCTPNAFKGRDCSQKLLAVYTTQSGLSLPCTGHGIPSADGNGYCICDKDYIGVACEIYRPNRQCGAGQSYLDTESVGIIVS
jgi:hypothetical protein